MITQWTTCHWIIVAWLIGTMDQWKRPVETNGHEMTQLKPQQDTCAPLDPADQRSHRLLFHMVPGSWTNYESLPSFLCPCVYSGSRTSEPVVVLITPLRMDTNHFEDGTQVWERGFRGNYLDVVNFSVSCLITRISLLSVVIIVSHFWDGVNITVWWTVILHLKRSLLKRICKNTQKFFMWTQKLVLVNRVSCDSLYIHVYIVFFSYIAIKLYSYIAI